METKFIKPVARQLLNNRSKTYQKFKEPNDLISSNMKYQEQK